IGEGVHGQKVGNSAYAEQGGVTNVPSAVNLSDFAQPETRRWRTAPRGVEVCDGVAFFCNGAMRTAGLSAAREGNRYPGAVRVVRVKGRGSRIELLQAGENALEVIEGSPYGRLVLHYSNGDMRRFELLLGVHGDNWEQPRRAQPEPVADPNSKIAWLQRR